MLVLRHSVAIATVLSHPKSKRRLMPRLVGNLVPARLLRAFSVSKCVLTAPLAWANPEFQVYKTTQRVY